MSAASEAQLRLALQGVLRFVRVGSGPLGEDPAAQAMRAALEALEQPASAGESDQLALLDDLIRRRREENRSLPFGDGAAMEDSIILDAIRALRTGHTDLSHYLKHPEGWEL